MTKKEVIPYEDLSPERPPPKDFPLYFLKENYQVFRNLPLYFLKENDQISKISRLRRISLVIRYREMSKFQKSPASGGFY